ncbi:MAG: hypothetical protein IKG01_08060, partial [Lachnospiraceae bacterium]|nr:hypothetical protein [Lachnospiraceae bacterium]
RVGPAPFDEKDVCAGFRNFDTALSDLSPEGQGGRGFFKKHKLTNDRRTVSRYNSVLRTFENEPLERKATAWLYHQ